MTAVPALRLVPEAPSTIRPVKLNTLTLDPEIQCRVGLDTATVDEYAQAMIAGARFPPAIVFSDSENHIVADGFHRVTASRLAKRLTIDVDIRSGTRRDALLFAASANRTHGLRRSNDDKRRAVAVLLGDPEWRTWSDRAVAEHAGVSPTFVGLVRGTIDDGECNVRRASDGREMDISRIGRLPLSDCHAFLSSLSVEWFTPRVILEPVRRMFGGSIALDPASCAKANRTVRASKFYSKEDDGLSRSWKASSTFLNPPYGRDGAAGRWVGKALAEHAAGHAREVIILLNSRTETVWFQQLWDYPLCFVKRAIRFVPGDDRESCVAATCGSVIAYVGHRPKRFIAEFKKLGRIVVPATAGVNRALPGATVHGG